MVISSADIFRVFIEGGLAVLGWFFALLVYRSLQRWDKISKTVADLEARVGTLEGKRHTHKR